MRETERRLRAIINPVVERIHQMVVPFDCSLHPDWLWRRRPRETARRRPDSCPLAAMKTARRRPRDLPDTI